MVNQRFAARTGRRARAAGCVIVSGLAALLSAAGSAHGQVQWRTGTGEVPLQMAPQELRAALNTLAARPDARHLVAHFDRPLVRAEKEAFEAAGLRLLAYVGSNAYFASLAQGDALNTGAIAAMPGLVKAEAVQREWKLDPDLADRIVHPWTVLNNGVVVERDNDPADAADDGKNAEARAENPTVAVLVMFHRDADLQAEAPAIIARHGGVIRSTISSIHTFTVHMPYESIFDLADEDAVQYLESPLPQLSEVALKRNDDNRLRTGANIVQQAPYNLNGAGVNVMVYDAGRMDPHGDFAGRLTAGDTDGTSFHATHVGGTIGGSGAGNINFRGMAPGVTFTSYGFQVQGGLMEGFLYSDPGDLDADYTEAILQFGADITNNSIGSNIESNGYNCNLQGRYGITNVIIDQLARGREDTYPQRIIWANGNERQGSRCNGPLSPPHQQYHSIAPPAGGKNHITIGALNSNDDSVTGFTSWGPTNDGRMKPDVSGPGCQSNGDSGVTSCAGTSGYASLCGTSMSSPTVCGLGAILLQDYRTLYPDQPDMRPATLKVILAHTALDITNPGPDYQTGYGSVRVQPAVDFLRTGNFVEAEVEQGDTYNLVVIVEPGDPTLKITLAWDDFEATQNVNPSLINDLDLVVTSPSGERRHVWTLNPVSPSAPAVQTAENHLDNIEQVFVQNPEPGGWRVEVRGSNVPSGGPQTFSVGGSPILVNCSSAGFAALGGARFNCASNAPLQVVDCDLNLDDNVIDTVPVMVSSTSEPAGEIVILTETAAASSAFAGFLQFSTTDSNGVLQVAEGDTVTLTYLDADDGEGGTNIIVTDDGVVDCTPPIVTNVAVSNVGPRSATVSFQSDEAATATVRFGPTCGDFESSDSTMSRSTSHSVPLSGILDNRTYFFAAEARDEAGNVGLSDNGGECYTFSTPDSAEFYTELFTGDNDLDNRTLLFFPDASPDFYGACVDTVFALPTDPAGGAALALGDNASVQVNLAGGAQVFHYGMAYSSFFVGSNGYITFQQNDTAFDETFNTHFSRRRVAALFDDLVPAAGQVTWRQLSDRAAVTWNGVREAGVTNSNTFQINLYFDGRIEISWLGIDATDGLAGLSRGVQPAPNTFFENDLTRYADCGPRPPSAFSQFVTTQHNLPVTIELIGTDDGLPEVPGQTTFIITDLPDEGRLYDPAAAPSPILTVPYTLLNNGDTVTYRPRPGFQGGSDSFRFIVSDGGTPPEGGDSNTAVVTIGVPNTDPEGVAEFLTNNQDPGWTTDPIWAFGTPRGNQRDPFGGFTGDKAYGYNLAGVYSNNLTPTRYLTSTAIDCSELSEVAIEFRRWLGVEGNAHDHATFEASNDGVNWTVVWANPSATIIENAWSLQAYDLSAVADDQATLYVRWGMGTTDDDRQFAGWNLDDIVFRAVFPPCAPDWTADRTLDSNDFFAYLNDYFNGDADYDNDSVTDSNDFFAFLNDYFAGCR